MPLLRARLPLLMFLEYFVWGAWLPLIFAYLRSLGFSTLEQSGALSAFAVGALVAVLFIFPHAPRRVAPERFMAVSHLAGGLAIGGLYFVRPGWTAELGGTSVHVSFWAFFLLLLAHALCYVPAILLTSSVTVAQVPDPQRHFGRVRLWRATGWAAASWPLFFLLANAAGGAHFQEAARWMFVVSAIASWLLAAVCLFLPRTLPKGARAAERLRWPAALHLLNTPRVLALLIVTLVVAAVHQCYFLWTNDYLQSVGLGANWVVPAMSLGQIAEVPAMATLGWCLARLGWRTTMAVGILAQALRFVVFAVAPLAWLAVAVNLVHGVCYAFFFAAIYLWFHSLVAQDDRAGVQGLFHVVVLGLGPLVANFVWPQIGEQVKTVDVTAAVVQGTGRQDLMVTGYINDPTTTPLGQQKLTIEEPGRPPYERLVALLPERTFEISLGQPRVGTYHVTVHWRRKTWLGGVAPANVKLPALVVGNSSPPGRLPLVRGKDFDYQRLFLFPAAAAFLAAIVLLYSFRPLPPDSAKRAGLDTAAVA